MIDAPPPGAHEALLQLPAAMRERQQWLVWRFEQYAGDKKPRKVPYYVTGGKRQGKQGSEADRSALARFEDALQVVRARRADGIGFAFLPGDGLVGIDIDGAIDADGVVSERCQKIIEACASYTELSPSGRGVHIIVAGETPTFKDNKIGLEVFCGRQFFTCTGQRWAGTPAEVAPLQDTTLRRLRATVKGAKAPDSAAPGAPAPAADKGVQRYCLAALESAVQRMRGTGEGGRNNALNTEAFGLAQLVHTGGISEATIRAALADAARATGLADSEIQATLASAIASGLQVPRLLPERPARRAGAARAKGGAAGDDGPPPGDPPGADDEPQDDGEWRVSLMRSGSGGKRDCRENVFMLLHHHPALAGLVGYDEFSHRVMKLRPPPWGTPVGEWSVQDDYQLGLWLAMHERLLIKAEGTLAAGVAMAAYERTFHPVLDYLKGLPAWDGVPRLKHWLPECLGAADNDYTGLVGTWFVMGMVQRVRNPGCQMDYMIVLEGAQGKRKSTALRTLVGNADWYADTPIRVGDRDALLSLAGKWLYAMDEMDSFSRAEVTAVKQYISSRVDRVREPYARRMADRPRSGVFAGTVNQHEYFKDPTGARRFWPVACDGDIDIPKLASWRDQLFAEAIARLESDVEEDRRYYPTRDETERFLVPEQEKREIGDPWFERLASWVDSSLDFGDAQLVKHVKSFTSHELLTKALGVPQDRIDGGRQMATRVGIAMHRLGWRKLRDSTGARLWRYWRPGHEPQQDGAAGGPAVERDDAF